MREHRKNFLLTGPPGIGKTSLVKKIYNEMVDLGPAGFITEEMRELGTRIGFSLLSFDGTRGTLAHIDMVTPYNVGKYGVDVAGFDSFLEKVSLFRSDSRIIILDEIGKMECFSRKFRSGVARLFDDTSRIVVATIALRGADFISELKGRRDVLLYEITHKNRNSVSEQIVREVRSALDEP